MTPAAPRRVCPACQRRYAGLIAPDCIICQGAGVLTLGAAALHHYDPAPIARAIELYLETHAHDARQTLPLGNHPAHLEAAVDNLRAAGVLASTADATGTPARTTRAPHDANSHTVTDHTAHQATIHLTGTHPHPTAPHTLNAPPIPLHTARPRDGRIPQASATGHPSPLATITNPIDPLGPDTTTLDNQHAATNHRARVIAQAIPTAATRRSNRP